jgi:hypothetical protein
MFQLFNGAKDLGPDVISADNALQIAPGRDVSLSFKSPFEIFGESAAV